METTDIKLKIPKLQDLELYFCDNVDQNTISTFNKDFIKLMNEYQNIIVHNNYICDRYKDVLNFKQIQHPVTINLSSYGGVVYDGLSMYNIIKSYAEDIAQPINIKIKASGMIASMGIILLLSVPEQNRVAYKNTTFLIHQVSTIALGAVKDVEDQVEEAKRLNNVLFDIIKTRTRIDSDRLKTVYTEKLDWILTAEEAKECGLISTII